MNQRFSHFSTVNVDPNCYAAFSYAVLIVIDRVRFRTNHKRIAIMAIKKMCVHSSLLEHTDAMATLLEHIDWR